MIIFLHMLLMNPIASDTVYFSNIEINMWKRSKKTCQVVLYMSTYLQMKNTRPISWIKAARKDFEEFPGAVQHDMMTALTVAAEGKNRIMPNRSGGLTEACFKSRCGIVGTPFVLFMP